MKRTFKRMIVVAIVVLAMPLGASALSLDEAKAKGLVGERGDGYLGAVAAQPAGDVAGLVADINAKRRAKYLEIAKQNGTDSKGVETLAGKKAIENTSPGHYILSGGNWVKK